MTSANWSTEGDADCKLDMLPSGKRSHNPMCESERKQRGPWDIIHQHRHSHHFESILLSCSLCCRVERESRVTLCLYRLLILVSGLLKQIHRGPHNPRRTEGDACLRGENGSSSLKRKTKHQLPVWWKGGEDHVDGPQQTLKEESITWDQDENYRWF